MFTHKAFCCGLRFSYPVGMDDPATSTKWTARATEARSLAEKMRDADARSTMLAIAMGYEKLARRAEVAKARASATSTDIYRSSNGDRWRLISDSDTGRRLVRHEPNRASGGLVRLSARTDRTRL